MRIPPTDSASPAATRGGVDLHLHSDISDGAVTDVALVDLLRAKGLALAAITDHDSISAAQDPALKAHLQALGASSPQVVPGVEISAWLDEPAQPGGWQEAHIVGLGCDPNNPKLRAALVHQRLNRYARVRACVEHLRQDGYNITFADVGFTARRQAPTGWHIGKLLADRGFAPDPDTAVKALVSPRFPKPDAIPHAPVLDTAHAIALIREAGGVAILAHPHRNVPSHEPRLITELLAKLQAEGLDGVEVYRVDMPAEVRPTYSAAASQVGLLESGGTDFHGAGDEGGPRQPGEANVPMTLWPPIAALIRARGGYTDVRDIEVTSAPHASAAERMLFADKNR